MKNKYVALLKDHEEYEKNPVRCWQLYEDLNPGLDFIVKLGINTVRPYTLASWSSDKSYVDLVVAVNPLGLTSKYLKSNPTFLKIKPSTSSFYVPSGRPLVMVANGTGIAPFRSLVQYFLANPT
jgi:NAD(P)H-flavin reductase